MFRKVEYIDPGTGGFLVTSFWQVILLIFGIALGFIMAISKKIKGLISRLFSNKTFAAALVIILIIFVSYFILIMHAGENTTTKKILLIGIDALDPNVIDELISEGKLPNFKKLKEIGSYSRLESTIPPETPVAWSAAATGSNPGKYGIFDFIKRDPKNYLLKLNLADETPGLRWTQYESTMKGVPFWRITSNAGIATTVIRWPVTFPPEKIKGKMLSGLGVVDIKGFLNSYSFYTSGGYDKESEGAKRVIEVEKGNTFETKLFGPRIKNGAEIEKPMRIKLEGNAAIISIDGSEHTVSVGGWSDWIEVKFSVDFFTNIYGIFKVYLLNTTPEFSMYVTSVQIDPKNQITDITYPKSYGKELTAAIGFYYTLGMPEDTKAVTENMIGKNIFLEQVRQIEDERTKMFWHEFDNFNSGVYAFAFDANDRLQHIFWENKVLSNSSRIKIPKEIEEYYADKDKFIGEVLQKIDGNTSLIVFSDHGFSSFERAVSINNWLVENGYMTLANKPDNDAGELFSHVDWSRTEAYALGFSSIYVNLKGREAQGIVEQSNYESLLDEIIEKLSKLKDDKNSKKVITSLYKGEEIYSGEFVKDAPDIVIGFEPGYRMSWQTAMGGTADSVLMDNGEEWTGDHLIDRSHVPGVIFTNFKLKKENPEIIDIAPTVLTILNLTIPKEMDGKSLVNSI
ncbi:MAG: alkaline phosphatase family protein [Candidatus Aenigmatarchaeota archaeon]